MTTDYIIYHPFSGTIIAADETVLISKNELPDNPDEWEDYLTAVSHFPVPSIPVSDLLKKEN